MNAELAENRAEMRADGVRGAEKLFGDLIGVGKAAAHPQHDIELGLRKRGEVMWRGATESDSTVWSRAIADGFVIGPRKGSAVREIGIGDQIKLGRAEPNVVAQGEAERLMRRDRHAVDPCARG